MTYRLGKIIRGQRNKIITHNGKVAVLHGLGMKLFTQFGHQFTKLRGHDDDLFLHRLSNLPRVGGTFDNFLLDSLNICQALLWKASFDNRASEEIKRIKY